MLLACCASFSLVFGSRFAPCIVVMSGLVSSPCVFSGCHVDTMDLCIATSLVTISEGPRRAYARLDTVSALRRTGATGRPTSFNKDGRANLGPPRFLDRNPRRSRAGGGAHPGAGGRAEPGAGRHAGEGGWVGALGARAHMCCAVRVVLCIK